MEEKGKKIYDFAKRIFPHFRSITGEGVRKTLADIKDYLEDKNDILKIYSIPSGTKAFDWVVPKEWQINEAYIEDEFGNHIIDIKDNNLHVVGYSIPVDKWVELDELKKYIYTQDDQPDVIPYVTSYYCERFGFCMSKKQKESLKPGKYHMYIDSKLFDGNLNYAEAVINGKSNEEIFFSTYICHPSMANNECSGPSLMSELIKYVSSLQDRKYTYRFVFLPETIGSITYLSQNECYKHLKSKVIAGFNLSCVGDNNDYSIVETKYADTLADKVLKNILKYYADSKYKTYSFLKRGSDERQYNAPGIDLPVVCFCRSKFGEYKEYHTSADNLDYISPKGFQGSYDVMAKVINALENNNYYKVNTLCEPQLGKRGIYPTLSKKGSYDEVLAMKDFIAYCDGKNDLVDISNIINVSCEELIEITKKLKANNIIDVVNQ